jgi:hypothetical protein
VKWEATGKVSQHDDDHAGARGGKRELFGLGPQHARWASRLAAAMTVPQRDEVGAAAKRVASIPGLVAVLLDVDDSGLRAKLLAVPFVVRALSAPQAAGPWLLERLRTNPGSALEFLELVSSSGKGSDVASLAVPWANLLPALLPAPTVVAASRGSPAAAGAAGAAGAAAGAAASTATSSGGREVGWAWGHVQRVSEGGPAWRDWRDRLRKDGRCLMALGEARDVVTASGALFPGEDLWAPVLLNLAERRKAARRLAQRRAKAGVVAAAAAAAAAMGVGGAQQQQQQQQDTSAPKVGPGAAAAAPTKPGDDEEPTVRDRTISQLTSGASSGGGGDHEMAFEMTSPLKSSVPPPQSPGSPLSSPSSPTSPSSPSSPTSPTSSRLQSQFSSLDDGRFGSGLDLDSPRGHVEDSDEDEDDEDDDDAGGLPLDAFAARRSWKREEALVLDPTMADKSMLDYIQVLLALSLTGRTAWCNRGQGRYMCDPRCEEATQTL